ncbi:MAG: efflux RND transporter periplasmic adaptor subunit [Bacteroidota bacterium]
MKIKNILIIIVIAGVLIGLKLIFFPAPSETKNDQQQGKGGANAVAAFVIKPENLENIVYASGTILANEEVELKPELSGKIISLPLKEGSLVSKGELLVKINDSDFRAQLKKLQSQYDLAETQVKRQQELLKINGISQQEFDISQNTMNTITADIDFVQSQITKTEIHAPFTGIVGLKHVSEGSYISAGTSIANVLQIDPVKIDFSVSERYAPFLQKEVKVLFNIEGMKEDMEGEIYAVEPKIDMNTRTIQVRAICPNKKATIYPGAFAHIKVLLKDIENAVMIPTEAVIPELRGKKVYTVKNGKAKPVMIETGVRTSDKIQVINGLQIGDTIVTTGIMQLKPDAAVKITQIK